MLLAVFARLDDENSCFLVKGLFVNVAHYFCYRLRFVSFSLQSILKGTYLNLTKVRTTNNLK